MIFRPFFLIFFLFVPLGCSLHIPKEYETVTLPPQIEPDYNGIVIPTNIAPLHFTVQETADTYLTEISGSSGNSIMIAGQTVKVPLKQWKNLLAQNVGQEIRFTVFIKQNNVWKKFTPLVHHVSNDTIAPYLVYRLIKPGYNKYSVITLEQRCLENFEKKPFFDNRLFGDAPCANCHQFQSGKTERAMIHIRNRGNAFTPSGTLLYQNGKYSKVNLRPDPKRLPCVYPAWHPELPLLAFATNEVKQAFHSIDLNKVSVFDMKSDLSLYDTEKNTLTPILETADELETYPNWSPDGKFLYYTSSAVPEALKKKENAEFDADTFEFSLVSSFRYNLKRIPFDAATRRFGEPELVIEAAKDGKSITFPRISPDGRYILYCLTNSGCFSIWHRESDLYLYDLQTDAARALTEINSTSSESYHNWTADGTWMVFTSRRDDGSYTRLYFSHFQEGKFSKPFILPQREPEENAALFYSYNVPELLTEPVPFMQLKLANLINSPSQPATLIPQDGAPVPDVSYYK